MHRLANIVLSALLLGLAGCSTTVFESIPTGTTTDCDPAWPGLWQPVDTANDATKPKDVLEISPDCRIATTKNEAKPKPMHLTLIGTRAGRQYLQIHNDDGQPDCIGGGKTHCGYVLMRYERDGDTIRLYDPDHAKVAATINKGSIKGFSERADGKELKTSEPVHRNFIAGDAGKIDKLLRQHPEIFNAQPFIVLHRVASAPPATDTAAHAEPMPPTPEH